MENSKDGEHNHASMAVPATLLDATYVIYMTQGGSRLGSEPITTKKIPTRNTLGLVSIAKCNGYEDEPSAIDNIVANDGSESNIEELGKDSSDLDEYVRDFFGTHARCDQALDYEYQGPLQLSGKNFVVGPKANLTIGLVNARVNINGTTEKFYVNKDTGNLVFSIRLTNFFIESDAAQFIMLRKNKEPKVLIDNIYSNFGSVIITATIPAGSNIAHDDRRNRITNWELQKATYYSYLLDSEYENKVGSKLTTSTDPEVQATVSSILSNVETLAVEFGVTGGPDVFLAYLQRYVCNFGIALPY